MPLPPALAARLAKRGIISAKNRKDEKENLPIKEEEDEEIIAEDYDESEQTSKKRANLEDQDELKAHIEAKFKGYPGCPNKSNVWHECTLFCKEYWGDGKKKPNRVYSHFRKKMLEQYPLPENWIEVYDPGTGRYYYWDEENDVVSWLPPSHPRALITDAAAHFREERCMVEDDRRSEQDESSDDSDSSVSDGEQKRQKRRHSSSSDEKSSSSDEDKKRALKVKAEKEKSRSKGRVKIKTNDLDPMDPASYSDIPRGSWSDGLNKSLEAKTGVDTTASGPLFQMRPYPSPGAVLRANAKQKKADGK